MKKRIIKLTALLLIASVAALALAAQETML